MTSQIENIQAALEQLRNPSEHTKITSRLPAESGLEAIGVRMKEVFDTAKDWKDLDVELVPELLRSRFYEMRMVGVSILDFKARAKKITDADRRRLAETYLENHRYINIWDLVDRAAPRVVGWYLLDKSREPLFELARSDRPIERRTAITAAFWLIRQADLDDAVALSDLLLEDDSELVTKPVGTALREIGKIDERRLVDFLRANYSRMSGPTWRLATYLLPDDLRADLDRMRG